MSLTSIPDYSSKETILCAGSIDTPKILLLSGVGPGADLTDNGIPVVLDQPNIGEHLLDHPILRLAAPIQDGFIDPTKLLSNVGAKEQWLNDRSGPLADDPVVSAHGYCKSDTTKYRGLETLDAAVQKHLTNPTTRTYEILSVSIRSPPRPHKLVSLSIVANRCGVMKRITPNREGPGFVWNISVVMMNNQSTGRVFLQKSNPKGSPGIDLNFLSSDYDTEAIIEAVQKTAKFLQDATIPTKELAPGPASLGESDVLVSFTWLFHGSRVHQCSDEVGLQIL